MATFAQAIGTLAAFAANARGKGAPAAADAMAEHFVTHERTVTLLESGTHARGMPGNAAPGQPPARVSGWLAASFVIDHAAGGGDNAVASAGPTAIYARIQEFGGTIHKSPGYMSWASNWDGGGWWRYYKHQVTIRPHPYMRRGLDEVIADGSLHDKAAEAFAAVVGD